MAHANDPDGTQGHGKVSRCSGRNRDLGSVRVAVRDQINPDAGRVDRKSFHNDDIGKRERGSHNGDAGREVIVVQSPCTHRVTCIGQKGG